MRDRAKYWSPQPDFGDLAMAGDGVLIASIGSLRQVSVGGDVGAGMAALGCTAAPIGPRETATGDPAALWLAPDRVALVGSSLDLPFGHSAWRGGFAVTDFTDSLLAFEISGRRRMDLIARGATLDFGDGRTGGSVAMNFAGERAWLYGVPEAIRLHVDRSRGAFIVEWFGAAMEAMG
jgi:hypothetical protein